MKCPGQDTRYWKPEDIFELACEKCGFDVEFFKDDVIRHCDRCGWKLINPKKDTSCAAHCEFSEKCAKEKLKETQ